MTNVVVFNAIATAKLHSALTSIGLTIAIFNVVYCFLGKSLVLCVGKLESRCDNFIGSYYIVKGSKKTSLSNIFEKKSKEIEKMLGKKTFIKVFCTPEEKANFKELCRNENEMAYSHVVRKALNEYLGQNVFKVVWYSKGLSKKRLTLNTNGKKPYLKVYCTPEEKANFKEICRNVKEMPYAHVIRKALNEYLGQKVFKVVW